MPTRSQRAMIVGAYGGKLFNAKGMFHSKGICPKCHRDSHRCRCEEKNDETD